MKLDNKEVLKVLQMHETTDFHRHNQWIANQDVLKEIHELMVVPYQGLSLIDSKLVIEDKNIIAGKPTGFAGDIGPHLTQSYLWVLGAYEIIRAISQYADNIENAHTRISGGKEEIRKLKHTFERIRIPLAKFEAPRKNPNGYTYAWPVLEKNLGTCWSVSSTEFISRRLLSDDFLKLMIKLSKDID